MEDALRSILNFFGLEVKSGQAAPAADSQTDAVRRIVQTLDEMEPEPARFIAAFAYILSRIAHADLKITSDETTAMERLVMERGGLSEAQAIMVVQLAKQQTRLLGATEDFLVTREFNKLATRDQKLALLDCLFAVAASEGTISITEDNAIRQVSRELQLEHREFIAVRSGYRDHLAVLQRLEDDSEDKKSV